MLLCTKLGCRTIVVVVGMALESELRLMVMTGTEVRKSELSS